MVYVCCDNQSEKLGKRVRPEVCEFHPGEPWLSLNLLYRPLPRKEASKTQNPHFKILKSAINVLKIIYGFKCIPVSATWSVLGTASFELQTAQQGKTVQ